MEPPVGMEVEFKNDLTSWLFDVLPTELTLSVLFNLDDKTLMGCYQICKAWYYFLKDNEECLYKDLTLSQWPHLENTINLDVVKSSNQINFKRFYRKRSNWYRESLELNLFTHNTKWTSSRKAKNAVALNGFHDGESIRTNKPWVAQTVFPGQKNSPIVYYYEVAILDAGSNQACGVGICDSTTPPHTLPGWNRGGTTCGYHADNGLKYYRMGHGKMFGEMYNTGDTIGCGYDRQTNSVFFTKNGEFIGVAFSGVSNLYYYPMIGSLEQCHAVFNFGEFPFLFDIDYFYLTEGDSLLESASINKLNQS